MFVTFNEPTVVAFPVGRDTTILNTRVAFLDDLLVLIHGRRRSRTTNNVVSTNHKLVGPSQSCW